mgnify:CR=1 FL=1
MSSLFPDGAVARLRVHGEVVPDWSVASEEDRLVLVATVNGGVCVAYSDSHYGHARNVIAPGRASRMDESKLYQVPLKILHRIFELLESKRQEVG